MIRTWKVVSDRETIKVACPTCKEPANRQCSYSENTDRTSKGRKKSRKAGMHYARWELAYTELHGPPNVPDWAGTDGLIEHGMFNGHDFTGTGKAWDA